jgi:hypothetical protein
MSQIGRKKNRNNYQLSSSGSGVLGKAGKAKQKGRTRAVAKLGIVDYK